MVRCKIKRNDGRVFFYILEFYLKEGGEEMRGEGGLSEQSE
jgi:hypothetical protein